MSRRKRKNGKFKDLRDLSIHQPHLELPDEIKRGITVIIFFVLGVVTLLSLVGSAGMLGEYIKNVLQLLFGVNRWYLPFMFIVIGYFLLRPSKYGFALVNTVGVIMFILGYNALIHLAWHAETLTDSASEGLGGGYLGLILAWPLYNIMGFWAALVVVFATTVIGLLLWFEVSVTALHEKRELLSAWWQKLNQFRSQRMIRRIQDSRDSTPGEIEDEENVQQPIFTQRPVVEVEQAGTKSAPQQAVLSDDERESRQLSASVAKFRKIKIDLPLDLLDGKTTTPQAGDIKANRIIIQKTLENFGIQAEMGDAQVGPTVTQYTLKPAEGVKLSRITGLGDNLALALAAHPIRIEAPVPGKSVVGIEVPNMATAIVPLREILHSEPFQKRTSNLSIALGKDVMGKPNLVALDKMPHLLIAGSTGSGKSVCINAVILSLLFQNGPGELKFIMVDPKRVELPIYNGIPHLLTPVITDVKKTINALRWAIKEMERRFDVLSQAHHRNIQSYNVAEPELMSYIVVVIDELADLMASAGPEVEAAIVRLAQMSRAVGIHLILATQRPSVDVITGLIKANITSRIAFSVASLVDSRTILDMSGAEKLLGRGDMLYISAEISKPKRLQGAFASDEEIKRVTNYLKERTEPDYVEEVVEKQSSPMGGATDGSLDGDDEDPLLPEAKEVILQAHKASASLLQRRLRIGYGRAARILDLLEAQGLIGPGDGARPREVLMGRFNGATMDSTAPGDDITDGDGSPDADDDDEEYEEDNELSDRT